MDSNQGSLKGDLVVYVVILALACVQVFFLKGHLFAMLSVAVVQAILAVSFFHASWLREANAEAGADSGYAVRARHDEYDLG